MLKAQEGKETDLGKMQCRTGAFSFPRVFV